MPILEKDIENKVVLYALSMNYVHFKLNGMGNRGKPDQLFVPPGARPIFVEFKRPREPLSPLQRYWARQLVKRGNVVYRCDNVEHGKLILQTHLDPSAVPIEGSVTYDETRKCWIVSGPWPGKDFYLFNGFQDPKTKRASE